MGNASAFLAAVGAFLCCWTHLPGEAARALAAVPCCALLLLLQEDGRLFRGVDHVAAVPLGALSAAWAGSAGYYVLLKVGGFVCVYCVFLVCFCSCVFWFACVCFCLCVFLVCVCFGVCFCLCVLF